NLERLPRLDLVGIGKLIAVRVENLHVRVRVAELLPRDLAQRITRSDLVRGRRTTGRGATADGFDVGDDVLLPCRNRLDGVPDLVRLLLGLNCAFEIELAIALLG